MPKTLLHRYSSSPQVFPVLASLYPPLLGAGIRVRSISEDWTSGELSMHVAPWTANTNGTAFGGALFSATDVLYGALLAGQLGRKYQVWTKSASIDFLRPGRGRLTLAVDVAPREAQAIRDELAVDEKTSRLHIAQIRDARGRVVAEARHTMTIRRRG